jgi:hypothetical protein
LKRLLAGRESRRGATAVEFALLAVPLLIGLGGGMDGLRYIYTAQALRGYAAQSFRAVIIAANGVDSSSCPMLSASMMEGIERPVGLDRDRLKATPSCRLDASTGIRTLQLQVSYSFGFVIDVFGGLTQSLTVTHNQAG